MDWSALLPTATDARERADDLRRWTDPRTLEGRRAALLSIEADLLITIMQAPAAVRVPLIAAAALVRLARG